MKVLENERLIILGRASQNVLKKLLKVWPIKHEENLVWLFVSYSDFEVPIGTSFDVVFLNEKPEVVEFGKSTLRFVTQQFLKEFDVIPEGWKTICLFSFENKLPELILQCPEVDEWVFRWNSCCISSFASWEAYCDR